MTKHAEYTINWIDNKNQKYILLEKYFELDNNAGCYTTSMHTISTLTKHYLDSFLKISDKSNTNNVYN